MNTVLWIIQFLLALAFGMAGLMKLTQPYEKLGERMAWVKSFSATQVRLIGLVELLAAFGLLLPGLTGILPILTPLAAAGLVLDMLGAAFTHLRRHENQMIIGNFVLLALALFIAYGRFVAVPL
jgi:uncharacterized membrane protein YphA (DoxX/SURF4 family)